MFQLLSFIGVVLIIPPSLLLLCVADTWEGRAFAITALCAGLASTLLTWGRDSTRQRLRWTAVCAVLLGGVLAAVLIARAPKGTASFDARVQHAYSDNQIHFSRYALGNLLPEGDQLMLGFTTMTMFDPLLTVSQARVLKRLTATIYRELENNQEFHVLGSTMSEVYGNLLGLNFDRGHSYLYIPSGLDRSRPAPALVFLHGGGGNFKAYLWILSKLADRLKLVLVAPSYGMGNWSSSETERVVQGALDTASRRVMLNARAIHLAGLSNGGLGVSQLGRSHGLRLWSLIFLSPVFDRASLQSPAFAGESEGRPILILTGGIDDRIPLSYVEDNVLALKAAGARATLEVLPDANHFMIFSHREAVLASLERWLNGLSGN